MKLRAAVVRNGVVVDMKVAAPEFAVKQGWVPVTVPCGIGWTYDGETFTPPPPQPTEPEETPEQLTERDMNSPIIKAVIAMVNADPAAIARARATLIQSHGGQSNGTVQPRKA